MSENSQLWIHLNKRCFEDNGTCPYCQIATLQAKVTELEAENAQARRTSQFHKDNHLAAGARLALLEKACEASATYIRHDSLRPSAAHKNAFFRLCDAGYLGEGGDE